MDKEIILKEAKRILELEDIQLSVVQAKEFILKFVGKESSLYKSLNYNVDNIPYLFELSKSVIQSFITFTENGLMTSMSYEREIQLETVSEYLDQANKLLSDKKVHPAAPAVIIGASLEEFLRNWLEAEGFVLTTIKNSIDAYTQELRKLNLINKQDTKDIISWAGTRNDAAHGRFEEVKNRERIKLMLEGVNLFIRKYTQE